MQENKNGVASGEKGGVEVDGLRVYLSGYRSVSSTQECHEYDCCLGKQMELKEKDKNEGGRKSRKERERDFSGGRMVLKLEVRKGRQFLYYSVFTSQKLFKHSFIGF